MNEFTEHIFWDIDIWKIDLCKKNIKSSTRVLYSLQEDIEKNVFQFKFVDIYNKKGNITESLSIRPRNGLDKKDHVCTGNREKVLNYVGNDLLISKYTYIYDSNNKKMEEKFINFEEKKDGQVFMNMKLIRE